MVRASERLSRGCSRAAIRLAVTLLAVSASPALADLAGVYAWTNFAGQPGGAGNADGTGGAARFNLPTGVAVDNAGNVYVADQYNHTIRKVTPGGMVTTLAGLAGSSGSTDGTGDAARFDHPATVAVDSAGNVYVADEYNHTIRKVTPAGVVTTLAGLAGSSGSTDGTGDAARFSYPSGVAADSAGNVYVADYNNHTIRKVTPAGVVTTLAGSAGLGGSTDGTGAAARFARPSGVAADGAGNVYVADEYNHTIRKVTPAGVVTTLAGLAGSSGSTDGTGSAARFRDPSGMAVDAAGNVYVADRDNNTIRKVTPAGVVTTPAGSAGFSGSTDGMGGAARFDEPSGVVADSAGNVYVADRWNHTIRKMTPAGVVTTPAGLAGSSGSDDGTGGAARFDEPSGVVADSAGNVYVADTGNSTIRKVTPTGAVTTLAGLAGVFGSSDGTGSIARFNYPIGVAADSAGNVYVADYNNSMIRKVTPAGVVTTLAGSAGEEGSTDAFGSAARFHYPSGVAADGAGNVYVADTYNHTIRKVMPPGMVMTLAGSAGEEGSIDAIGSAALFSYPSGVAADDAGNVYVADKDNHTIRKVTPAGVVTTLAGQAGSAGSTDGMGNAARFNSPTDVAVDSAGNVYVVDSYSHTIRKVTPTGMVTTIGGTPGVIGGTGGAGGSASFSTPWGIAADAAGNLYVADANNNRISKGTPPPTITASSPLPAGTVGAAYSRTLTASGGATPYTWSISSGSLPSGLALSADGLISGTPTAATTADFTVRVAGNDGAWSTKDFRLITAAPTRYALTVNVVAGHGTVTPTGGAHDEGTVVALTATPDAGYRVLAWSGTDDDGKETNTNSVTMNGDKTVTVAFESIPVVVYSLTIVPDLDNIEAPAPESYAAGSVVTVQAPPAPDGYKFDHWSGDASGTDNPIEVVMDGDKELIASYVQTTNTNTTTQRGCGQDLGLFNVVLFGTLSVVGLCGMKHRRGRPITAA